MNTAGGNQKRTAPFGYYTLSEAASVLGVTKGMIANYVKTGTIIRHVPPPRKNGYYGRAEINNLAARMGKSVFLADSGDCRTTFALATYEDLEEIHDLAVELFGSTPLSVEDRKPFLDVCPQGNYVVKHAGAVVASITMLPTKPEYVALFLAGEIRSLDIPPDGVECLIPGRPIDIVVRSIGATQRNGALFAHYYMRRLFSGLRREFEKLGQQGINIRKIYASSDTGTGKELCMSANMKVLKKLRGRDIRKGLGARFLFGLDVAESDLSLLRPYKNALAIWQAGHATQEQ